MDADYETAGAGIVSAESAWNSELVIKVKEPLEQEYGYLNGQILFTLIALTTATLPFVQQLAAEGIDALRNAPHFALGLNTYKGYITCKAVAESLGKMSRFRAFSALS